MNEGDGPELEPHRIDQYLKARHARNAAEPIRYPDEAGRFPESWIHRLLGDPFLIVVDANILRDDIGYSCANNRLTILTTCANNGTFRLFCARHVFDEVAEHGPGWAAQMGLDREAYLDCWYDKYAPHLRLIPPDGLSSEMFTQPEKGRLSQLAAADPDDVPSAMLSLALGAFYLTKDTRAWCAVYGRKADSVELERWREPLRAGGDAGELAKLVFMAGAVPTMGIIGIVGSIRWVVQKSPWLLGLGAVLLGALATRIPMTTYKSIGSGVAKTASFLGNEIFLPYHEYTTAFHQQAPDIPTWLDIGSLGHRTAALTRACLYHLARSPADMSARELAQELPDLGIGQGEQLVRSVLRSSSCFYQTYKGRWQAGAADAPNSASIIR